MPYSPLEELLAQTKYAYVPGEGHDEWIVGFEGKLRQWPVLVTAHNGWLHVCTDICYVPGDRERRYTLFAWALQRSALLALTKFAVRDDQLMLDVDYRFEHLNASILGSLVKLSYRTSEDIYSEALRITGA